MRVEREDGTLRVVAPQRRAAAPLAARADAHPDRQHGHRRHRRLHEDARDQRRRLPRRSCRAAKLVAGARLLPPGGGRPARRHRVRGRDADAAARLRRRQGARRPDRGPDPLACASRSRTRARASATRASRSAARPARPAKSARSRRDQRRIARRASAATAPPQPHQRQRGSAAPVVFRSADADLRQVIDDSTGRTLAAASSRESGAEAARQDRARAGGRPALAERAKAAGVSRSSSTAADTSTTGASKPLAEGAREGGLTLVEREDDRPMDTHRCVASSTWTRTSSRSTASPRSSRAGAASASARSSSSATARHVGVGLGKAERGARGDPQGRRGREEAPDQRADGGTTIPHEIIAHFGAAKVMLKPAARAPA